MNKKFAIVALFAVLLADSCGLKGNQPSAMMGFASFADEEEQVYICTGPYSKKYHSTEYCQWLGSCSEEIEEVSLEEAEDMGRTPCKACYGK